MSAPASRLDARYGRRPSHRRRNRLLIGLLAVVFVIGVVVVGLRISSEPVRAETVSYAHVSSNEISVTFRVTMKPGTKARCTVEALDSNRGQVGFDTVDIPANAQAHSVHTATIATQGKAVSATVDECSKA